MEQKVKENYDNQQIINIILDFVNEQHYIMNYPFSANDVLTYVIDKYEHVFYNNMFYLIKYTKKVLKYLIYLKYVEDKYFYYITKTKIKKNVKITPEDIDNYFKTLQENAQKQTQ